MSKPFLLAKEARMRGPRRSLASGLMVLATAAFGLGGCAFKPIEVPANAAAVAREGAPGTIVAEQPVGNAPSGATAYRVLYRSTGIDDTPILVSGMIFVPAGPAPPGSRPVVAWAHPTTGVVSRCAPSLSPLRMMLIPGLGALLKQGYVVSASDYDGLGTGGIHPFLDGPDEARSVLDGVRAAMHLREARAAGRFVVWGHSQGGQAALFTGMDARRYAPELTLEGVAATSPATDLGTLFAATLDGPEGKNVGAMALWSWSRVYGAPLSTVIRPDALPKIDFLAQQCIGAIRSSEARKRDTRFLSRDFLTVPDLMAIEPWKTLAQRNSPGPLPRDIPVWIAQGSADGLVLPRITRAYAQMLCRNGSRVRYDLLPGVKHGFAAFRSADPTVDWLSDRLEGLPAPDDCESLLTG